MTMTAKAFALFRNAIEREGSPAVLISPGNTETEITVIEAHDNSPADPALMGARTAGRRVLAHSEDVAAAGVPVRERITGWGLRIDGVTLGIRHARYGDKALATVRLDLSTAPPPVLA
ncbi:MAG: hypothetical protein AAFW01_00040 [Pseudomonadota bacterium]